MANVHPAPKPVGDSGDDVAQPGSAGARICSPRVDSSERCPAVSCDNVSRQPSEKEAAMRLLFGGIIAVGLLLAAIPSAGAQRWERPPRYEPPTRYDPPTRLDPPTLETPPSFDVDDRKIAPMTAAPGPGGGKESAGDCKKHKECDDDCREAYRQKSGINVCPDYCWHWAC